MGGAEISDAQVEVMLMRTALETAAHDLGGLSSALNMHLDVLQMGGGEQGLEAVKGINAELRALGRQLRELRGPAGGAALAPTRAGLLPAWLARTLRFGRAHLPRGTALEGELPETPLSLSDESAHALTLSVFALLRELRSVLDHSPGQAAGSGSRSSSKRKVLLTGTLHDAQLALSLTLFVDEAVHPISPSDSAWWTFAQSRASTQSISLEVRESSVTLVAPLSPS